MRNFKPIGAKDDLNQASRGQGPEASLSTLPRRNPLVDQIILKTGDITQIEADAVVTSANCALSGGGGVDGAIHRAAGPELAKHCKRFAGVEVGSAVISPGFGLATKYVIHALPPVWDGGEKGEADLLRQCCLSALNLAEQHGIRVVAFPALAMGAYRFPANKAAQILIQTISEWLNDHDYALKVILVSDEKRTRRAFESALNEISEPLAPDAIIRGEDKTNQQSEVLADSIGSHMDMVCASELSRPAEPGGVLSSLIPPKSLHSLISLVEGDITTIIVDAIATPANRALSSSGALNGAVHKTAGPMLTDFCRGLKGAVPGEAVLSPAFNLPSKFVIHCVAPPWEGGGKGEVSLLAQSCRRGLGLAYEAGARSIAFPALAMGANRFPPDQAAATIVKTVIDFLKERDDPPRILIVVDEKRSKSAFDRAIRRQIEKELGSNLLGQD